MKSKDSNKSLVLNKNEILFSLSNLKIKINDLESSIQKLEITYPSEDTFLALNEFYKSINDLINQHEEMLNHAKFRPVIVKKTGNVKEKINIQIASILDLKELVHQKLSDAFSNYRDNMKHTTLQDMHSIQDIFTEIKKNLKNSVSELLLKEKIESTANLVSSLDIRDTMMVTDRKLLRKVIDIIEPMRTTVENLTKEVAALKKENSELRKTMANTDHQDNNQDQNPSSGFFKKSK